MLGNDIATYGGNLKNSFYSLKSALNGNYTQAIWPTLVFYFYLFVVPWYYLTKWVVAFYIVCLYYVIKCACYAIKWVCLGSLFLIKQFFVFLYESICFACGFILGVKFGDRIWGSK